MVWELLALPFHPSINYLKKPVNPTAMVSCQTFYNKMPGTSTVPTQFCIEERQHSFCYKHFRLDSHHTWHLHWKNVRAAGLLDIWFLKDYKVMNSQQVMLFFNEFFSSKFKSINSLLSRIYLIISLLPEYILLLFS